MRILLDQLVIKDFMGIKDLTITPAGRDLIIRGDNGTGKTTIASAWSWLLFGKDSTGKADFSLKPLDKDNKEIHNLETTVEGILIIEDGQTSKKMTLKRVFMEKWTRKRGQAQAEHTGHTTKYYIDGVPVPEKEYKAKVAELMDEEMFNLLTIPGFFNERLHWTRRRDLLIEIAGGDVTPEAVAAGNPRLERLAAVLKERDLEKHRAVLLAQKKKINEDLDKIPVRIDEVSKGLPDISDINAEALPKDIELIQKEIKALREKLVRLENGGEIAEKKKRLSEIEAELIKIRADFDQGIQTQIAAQRKRIHELQGKKITLSTFIKSTSPRDTTELEQKINRLRERWTEKAKEEFQSESICPYCGQPLPPEKIEEARSNFNMAKALELKEIAEEGKRLATELELLKEANQTKQQDVEEAKEEIALIDEQIASLEQSIAQLERSSVEATPTYLNTYREKMAIEAAIEKLKAGGNQEAIARVKEEIASCENALAALQEAQRRLEDYRRGKARISELEALQKELARQFEEVQKELDLCDEYTRTRVRMVEERVNAKFKYARFKMFQEQINGGIEEICETIFNGVPYSTGLNTGHRMLVDLDIIQTLGRHYDFCPPVFVDNAESITNIPEMDAQVIRLIKPDIRTEEDRKKYSKLQIETEEIA